VTRSVLLVVGLLAAGPVGANHPLITEDTETVGRGRWELELHGERSRDRENGTTSRAAETSVTLHYGIGKDVEVEVELPYVKDESARGRGDMELELKWNFLEHDGLALTLKPRLTLPTGREDPGLGTGRAGFGLGLIVAREVGVVELIGEAGYLRNRNRLGERVALWHLSTAFLWAATERLRLFVDFSRDTNPDPAGVSAIREWVYGFMYDVSSAIDFGLGVKNGLSEAADDRALLAGLRLRW
jgi:hypothetical protein